MKWGIEMHPAFKMPFDELYSRLVALRDSGMVIEKVCPWGECASLRLYCYTDECVYSGAWDSVSLLARGLVLDIDARRVVAAPFPKFFNYQELDKALPENALSNGIPNLPFEVFEKLDGSLIIIFYYAGRWRCVTKGSFESSQALWAQGIVDRKDFDMMSTDNTYLCEAIYPENRIVVRYDTFDIGLHLLAVYGSQFEFPYKEVVLAAKMLEIEFVERHAYNSISELLEVAAVMDSQSEGFVVRFSDGYRLKIKGDEYCRIHRMVSRLTPLCVWELMKDDSEGVGLEKYRRELPEEFWEDFDTICSLLIGAQKKIEYEVFAVAEKVAGLSYKEIGIMVAQGGITGHGAKFIFPYLKGGIGSGRAREALFREIRPVGNRLEGYVPSSSVTRVAVSDG